MNQHILQVKPFIKIPLMLDFFHLINNAKSKTGFILHLFYTTKQIYSSTKLPQKLEQLNLYGVSCSPTHFPRGLRDGGDLQASTQDS
ncbi:hypothetical protein CEXT_223261 [Caerostris extrusa]|uniref:Uncharacterized protein n=1 Tax=Caerostris extrusa TaxID=172846 RepID=A0AAV4TJF1_CAEEX|nr:hypothetical protein CEXT_223261 [Caerostris extrusa]